MKHAATQELYHYWASLCRGRAAPERNDIEPAAIRGILADTFMIDIDVQGSFPIRISGTRMNALFCRELKGVSLSDLWDSRDRAEIVTLIGDVLDDVRPMVAGVTGEPVGHGSLALEMALFPLRYKGRTHARLLGCLSPQSIPSWLGLAPVQGLRLGTHRMVGLATLPNGGDLAAIDRRVQPGAERARPVRRGHFTVYEGGQSGERRKTNRVIAM